MGDEHISELHERIDGLEARVKAIEMLKLHELARHVNMEASMPNLKMCVCDSPGGECRCNPNNEPGSRELTGE